MRISYMPKRRQQKLQRHVDPRRPADLIVLLPGKAKAQPIHAFAIAAAGDNAVNPLLIASVDRVERLAAMIEVELMGLRAWQGGRQIMLESRRDDLIFLVAD